ncbi:MAG: flagellar hook basal-body protein, partial [Desulfatitalea sp.]|nr:flagellar hook basal-body protein [Desulfatitalea sp.]
MSGAIYQAAAGALLQQIRLDVLSNNLANVNTSGFKADQPIFRVNPADTATPSAAANEPGRISPYAPPMEARTNYDNGPMTRTGNSLDVAIVGKGFFEIQTPDGPRFTRKGNFTVNEQGVLATAEGWPVKGEGGDIAIEEGRVEIGDQGEVRVDGDVVATIRVVDFPEPYNLVKTGDTLFMPAQGAQSQTVQE